MIIYRVETSAGIGMYRADFNEKYNDWTLDYNGNAMWAIEQIFGQFEVPFDRSAHYIPKYSFGQRIVDETIESPQFKNWKFAFSSVNQLFTWLNDNNVLTMLRGAFDLKIATYYVPFTKVRDSKHQCVYKVDCARLITVQEIDEFYREHNNPVIDNELNQFVIKFLSGEVF